MKSSKICYKSDLMPDHVLECLFIVLSKGRIKNWFNIALKIKK